LLAAAEQHDDGKLIKAFQRMGSVRQEVTAAAGAMGRSRKCFCRHGCAPVAEPEKRRGVKVIPYDATPASAKFERLNRAVETAELKVPIAEAFELVNAAKAHQRLAEGQIFGKIVLRILRS
jgi:hypothetical protein